MSVCAAKEVSSQYKVEGFMKNLFQSIIMVISICFTAMGCANLRMYPGAERGKSEIATLESGGTIRLEALDNYKNRGAPDLFYPNTLAGLSAHRIEILPGKHDLVVWANNGLHGNLVNLSFTAEAGKSYVLKYNEVKTNDVDSMKTPYYLLRGNKSGVSGGLMATYYQATYDETEPIANARWRPSVCLKGDTGNTTKEVEIVTKQAIQQKELN